MTYRNIMADILARAPAGIDTRQGSVYFDALSAYANILARAYSDIDTVFDMVFLTTATGEYLDAKAYEFGITRQPAIPAVFRYVYTGTTPPTGSRFFHSETGIYFSLYAEDGTLYLEAETAGTAANVIQSGDLAVPVNTIPGLTTSEFGTQYKNGAEAESDDDLRQRIIDKISGPAANGNRAHYKSWCESIDGVGRARIYPLWNGENTVKAVLVDADGKPVGDGTVAEVQAYIDPNKLGATVTVGGKTYNVGDGVGDGVANIGAHFTAVKADRLNIAVSFDAELETGKTEAEAQAAAEAAIAEYIKGITLDTADDLPLIVRINAVGAIISGLTEYIVDYSNLKLNGGSANITATGDQVPILNGVTVHETS